MVRSKKAVLQRVEVRVFFLLVFMQRKVLVFFPVMDWVFGLGLNPRRRHPQLHAAN